MHWHRRNYLSLALAATTMVAFAMDAAAQQPARSGRGGLARLDANGDGILQPEEIPARAKPIIGRMAERAGLDPNGPIPLDRLARQAGPGAGQGGPSENRENERQENRGDSDGQRRGDRGGDERGRGDRDNDERDDDDRRRDGRDDDDRPERRPDALPIKITGFGFDLAFPRVPGFDVPLSATSGDGPTLAELQAQHDGRTIGFARRLLERADENGNTIIDPSEWGRLRWRGDPDELDLNRDARLTLAELIQGVARQQEERREREENNGERREGDRGPDNAQSPQKDATPPRGENDERVAQYARDLIRQHDRNKNGVIDGDERRGMRGQPPRPDVNGDGTITEEELVARMHGQADEAQRREAQAQERARRVEARRGGNRARGERSDSGGDRGPAWFRSRDKDGDGQVAMSEFATRWDDAKVAEFAAHDKNGDGVIALSEAAP
jgi:hypothetical protein